MRIQSNSTENIFIHLQANLKQVLKTKDWNTVNIVNEGNSKLKDIFNNYVSDSSGLTQIKTLNDTALYQNVIIENDELEGWTGTLSNTTLETGSYEIYNSSNSNIEVELVYDNNNNIYR